MTRRTKRARMPAKQTSDANGQRVVIANRTAKARALAKATRKANADRHAANVLPFIREARKNGAQSLREIAAVLTASGVPTRNGGRWHAVTVKNVLERTRRL
jgi:hypothetical protein